MSKRLWELINSWWLIFPFTIYLNWMAFLYIGVTARHRKWIFYGIMYAIPVILYQVFLETSEPISLRFEIILSAVWLIGVFSIVHAFFLRKEYLIRLEVLKEVKKDKLKKEILHEYDSNENTSLTNQDPSKNTEKQNIATDSNEFNKDFTYKSISSKVDINTDSEDLLMKLPGVSLILAKKAVQLRESGVYFDSAEDFGLALGLKPHIVKKIEPYVVIKPLNNVPTQTTSKTKGRRIDI